MEKEKNEILDIVQIVTIKDISILYKGDDPATYIEKVSLEENDFPLITQKNLYSPGDKVVYIQPDYNLPDIELFESFIRPGGDPSKSILGSKNRIRAKKFAFHLGNGESVYSVGILLPLLVVEKYISDNKLKGDNLTEKLGVYKYEEPEPINGGKQNSGSTFPSGMYKTDEPNWNNVSKSAVFPGEYVGTVKSDGSSTTTYYSKYDEGICSRNMKKPLTIKKVIGKRKLNFIDKIKKFFGSKIDLRLFETVDNDDKFVILLKSYLEKLKNYCADNKLFLALRGEANGQTWKGSGNKNNPDAKNNENVKFFGIDDLSSGRSIKLGELEFDRICTELELNRCEIVFKGYFETKEDLILKCEEYFKNNLIEGIVIRNFDSTFSAKYMSLEYDSKK